MIIETVSGKLQGIKEDELTVFRGIPYAAPPVGERRFQPPTPHPGWSGIRDSAHYGPIAVQAQRDSAVEQSEDCLTLNVWTKYPVPDKRPVLVYVHGGGFTFGSGRSEEGRKWAAQDDIVYVSVNYRLGALGFLQLGHLLGESYHSSGNNGLLDVIAALRWVQDHISLFGGDPGRVTLIGGSAGAKLICSLLAVPAAHGLFHGIIAQSGATQSVRDLHTAKQITRMLCDHLDIGEANVSKLLELPADVLVAAQQRIAGIHKFGPVIDGITLMEEPLKAIASCKNYAVPLLIGTNREEAKSFTLNDPLLQMPNIHNLLPFFGHNAPSVWKAYCSASVSLPSADAWSKVLTEHLYLIAAVRLAEAITAHQAGVWVYRFDRSNAVGAVHSIEWPFVYHLAENEWLPDGWERPSTASDKHVAKAMHAAWRAFVHTGSPYCEELPKWVPFTSENRAILVLDDPLRAGEAPSLSDYDSFPNQALML